MKKILCAVNMICLAMIMTVNASAYIDPATTSYIVQIVAGVVIAGGAVVGIYFKKIKSFFKKKKGEPEIKPAEKKPVSKDGNEVVTADDLLDD